VVRCSPSTGGCGGRRMGANSAPSACSCGNDPMGWNALPLRRRRCRRMQGQDRGPADRSERSVPGSCRSLLGGDRSVRLQAGSYADSPNGADGATRPNPVPDMGEMPMPQRSTDEAPVAEIPLAGACGHENVHSLALGGTGNLHSLALAATRPSPVPDMGKVLQPLWLCQPPTHAFAARRRMRRSLLCTESPTWARTSSTTPAVEA